MQPETILLVEDNPDDVTLIKRALSGHGLANVVVVAQDGVEALDYFFGEGGTRRPLPTLVILDLMLPKVSGLEVLVRLRAEARTALLPVVVLTASQEQGDLIDSYRSGANSCVRKPVDFSEFFQAARALGLYWLLTNEPPSGRGELR